MWLCVAMKFVVTDPRVKQALLEWAEIAPTLSLDAKAFRSKLIWQKDEPGRSHVVIRLTGPRRLILKRTFVDDADGNLSKKVATQRDAFRRLVPYQKAHVPEVLYASQDGKIVVMSDQPGKTLNDHLQSGRSHDQMLRRAGAWLAAFHQSGPAEIRTYQPRFMVAEVERRRTSIAEGEISVALPDLYVRCCAEINELAKQVVNQQTVSSCKHGDFNLRNILLGPDGETGLDFKPASTAPVGFDIARLLMDYAELFQPLKDVPVGAVLSDDTLDAFFKGYDVVGREDPTVRFLPYVQLLTDWRAIPPDPDRGSWRQVARMEAIEALARKAFDLK